MEDSEYLAMLSDAIAAARARGADPVLINEAHALESARPVEWCLIAN